MTTQQEKLAVAVAKEVVREERSFRKNRNNVDNVNKPKKLNKKIKKQLKQNTKAINRLYNGKRFTIMDHVSLSDTSLTQSVHQAASSFFYPQLGIHRGQAKAFEMSGLAMLKGSLNATNAVGTNTVFAFQILPSYANNAGWLQYGFGTTPITAIAANSVGALISSTQAESFRVVGATLCITPQGSLTNQAGSGLTGYVTDNNNFTFNSTNVANLRLNRPFKSIDTQILHWLPSENSGADETEFQGIAGTPSSASEIVGYITIPAGSDTVTAFQLDYCIGFEYIPSPAYRPWVDLDAPCQDIRANQYVNHIARKHFDPLMIGTIQDYNRTLELNQVHGGGRIQAHQNLPDLNSAVNYGYMNDISAINNSVLQADRSNVYDSVVDIGQRAYNAIPHGTANLLKDLLIGDLQNPLPSFSLTN